MMMSKLNILTIVASFLFVTTASAFSEDVVMDNKNKLQKRMNVDARRLLDEMRQHVKSVTVPYDVTDNQKNVWDPVVERRMEVVQQARSLRVNNKDSQVNQMMQEAQRKLAFTGQIWDACIPDDTPTSAEVTAQAYDNVQYDDAFDPSCVCLYDKVMKELWMQCTLGDETCIGVNNTSCAETHEVFLFSPNTGDLSVKNTCHFCNDYTNTNCTGIQEVCSVVFFDDNETPQQCIFQEVLEGGNLENCDNCQICKDDAGETGMNYDCFGKSTNGQCDTTVSFHVHNFAPVLDSGAAPVGGRFGETCKKNEEVAIYGKTTYDEPFGKVCDCDDPTSGVIVCDLYLDVQDCFANECSPISEIFYFGQDSGELNEKVTCDATTGLCSRVGFSSEGRPTTCEVVLFPDPAPCTQCSICQDDSLAYGITFKCFGASQTECLTSNGRAINNFVDQPTRAPASANQPTSTPVGTTPAINEAKEIPEESVPVGAIVGAFFGGLVLSGIFAFLCARKSNKGSDEDSAGGTPAMVEAALNHNDDDDDDVMVDETEPKEVPQLT